MLQPVGSVIEVCYITRDMDPAMRYWTNVMGAGPFFTAEMKSLPGEMYRGQPSSIGMKVGFAFTGGLLIELIQQTDNNPSVFREVMDERGEGFHHVMLRQDYDQGMKHLTGAGYECAFTGKTATGERFALIDTRKETGGFVELMDMSPMFTGLVEKMEHAHRTWDRRTDPVRSLYGLIS
jgi:hypothetical protein